MPISDGRERTASAAHLRLPTGIIARSAERIRAEPRRSSSFAAPHAECARFHRDAPPAAQELERLLETLIRRITRTLVRSDALVAQEYDNGMQAWLDLDPEGEDALVQLQDASIRYRIAVGSIAGRKTLRLHAPGARLERQEQPKSFTAARECRGRQDAGSGLFEPLDFLA